METPIYDFVQRYAAAGNVRLHMPGHKGKGFLGVEANDITEVLRGILQWFKISSI